MSYDHRRKKERIIEKAKMAALDERLNAAVDSALERVVKAITVSMGSSESVSAQVEQFKSELKALLLSGSKVAVIKSLNEFLDRNKLLITPEAVNYIDIALATKFIKDNIQTTGSDIVVIKSFESPVTNPHFDTVGDDTVVTRLFTVDNIIRILDSHSNPGKAVLAAQAIISTNIDEFDISGKDEHEKYYSFAARLEQQFDIHGLPPKFTRHSRLVERFTSAQTADPIIELVIGNARVCIQEMLEKIKQDDTSVSNDAFIRLLATFGAQKYQNLLKFENVETSFAGFPKFIELYNKLRANTESTTKKRKERTGESRKLRHELILMLAGDKKLTIKLAETLKEQAFEKDGTRKFSRFDSIGFFGDIREILYGVISTDKPLSSEIHAALDHVVKVFGTAKLTSSDAEKIYLKQELLRLFDEEYAKNDTKGLKIKFMQASPANQSKMFWGWVVEKMNAQNMGELNSLKGLIEKNDEKFEEYIASEDSSVTSSSSELSPLAYSWELQAITRYASFMQGGRGRAGKDDNPILDVRDLPLPRHEHTPALGTTDGAVPDHGTELAGGRAPGRIMSTSSELYKQYPGLAFYGVLMCSDGAGIKQLGSPEVNEFIYSNREKRLIMDDDAMSKIYEHLAAAIDKNADIPADKKAEAKNAVTKKLNRKLRGKSVTDPAVIAQLQYLAIYYYGTQYIDIANSFGYAYRAGASGHTGHILSLALIQAGLLTRDESGAWVLDLESGDNKANYARLIQTIYIGMEKAHHHTYEEVLAAAWLFENSHPKIQVKGGVKLGIKLHDMDGSYRLIDALANKDLAAAIPTQVVTAPLLYSPRAAALSKPLSVSVERIQAPIAVGTDKQDAAEYPQETLVAPRVAVKAKA